MTRAVGIDLVEIARFARVRQRRPRVIERVFTPAEIEYCLARQNQNASFAVRFAAKEAVIKLLGSTEGIAWSDIEILMNATGQPEVRLRREAERRAEDLKIRSIVLSLSHSRYYAVAVAVAD
ncbi:MAG: holo-ACP synthase [Firmicutes bacterium]|nr:holo-ACP synthase [Bacillota bacterium]